MKNKKLVFFLLTAFTATSLFINSCKKDNSGAVNVFLTHAPWQLASVQVFHYLGSSLISTDTLNLNCNNSQIFTFNINNTCTYTNFECIPQTTSGTWALTPDQLVLNSTMLCADTLVGGAPDPDKAMPFKYTKIYNLGQYSLILQTGDVNIFVTSTTRSRIIQYGFVHPSGNNQ
ncbi:hypothetical protein [Mucilaginibacter sp.]